MGEFDRIKTELEARLAQLIERVSRIEGDLRKPGDRDWAERAIELENEEVLERLDEAETREANEIRAALAKIAAGTYGVCDHCGETIDGKRLDAIPFAARCVGCAD